MIVQICLDKGESFGPQNSPIRTQRKKHKGVF